jgi:hypothetical protein
MGLSITRVKSTKHNTSVRIGAVRWTEQFKDTATVDKFSFQGCSRSDGEPIKDLNDLLKISTESYRKSAKVIDKVMRF